MIRSPSSWQDGLTDERAIPVQNATSLELESLLHFFYNMCVTACFLVNTNADYDHFSRMHDDDPLSLEQWIALLAFSHRFAFPRVHRRCIVEIGSSSDFDPVEKIILARRYGILHWLAPAYEALCQRTEPLDVMEAEKLGARTTALVARAREEARQTWRLTSTPGMPTPSPFNALRVSPIVAKVFFNGQQ
jgi:hypothetical protein